MSPSKSTYSNPDKKPVADGAWNVIEEAAHECVSEEALVHLKSYKYSSVDKSLISNYILKHYVRCKRPRTKNRFC
jgi:ethanolaminephosphotransferase